MSQFLLLDLISSEPIWTLNNFDKIHSIQTPLHALLQIINQNTQVLRWERFIEYICMGDNYGQTSAQWMNLFGGKVSMLLSTLCMTPFKYPTCTLQAVFLTCIQHLAA